MWLFIKWAQHRKIGNRSCVRPTSFRYLLAFIKSVFWVRFVGAFRVKILWHLLTIYSSSIGTEYNFRGNTISKILLFQLSFAAANHQFLPSFQYVNLLPRSLHSKEQLLRPHCIHTAHSESFLSPLLISTSLSFSTSFLTKITKPFVLDSICGRSFSLSYVVYLSP